MARTKRHGISKCCLRCQLDDAELARSRDESQLIASQSRLSQLKIAERSRRKDISDSLTAPFTRHVITGAIGLGQIAFQQRRLPISQTNHLLMPFVAKAEIYAQAPQLLGQTVTAVTWQSGARDVAVAKAYIARTNAELEAQNDGGGRLYAEMLMLIKAPSVQVRLSKSLILVVHLKM